MFPKIETSFPSMADGLRISVLCVLPEHTPYRGIVQLVHGMSENKERYLPFMEYLAQEGYVSLIHDQRGHGGSVRSKEDLGYMYGGGAQAILQDIDTINDGLREHFPGLPLVLFGHSMGSLAVRSYTAKHDDKIDLLVVCGSPSENSARWVAECIAKLESKLLGPHHRSKLLTALSLGNYIARFKKEGNPNAWICSDAKVYEAYGKSELCGFMFTDDGYLALYELMKQAYDLSGFRCTNPSLPVLFISGAEDPCMGNVRKFSKAVHAMRYAGYRRVKGRLYPGMRHEILNEKEHEKVFQDILIYMKKNLPAPKAQV